LSRKRQLTLVDKFVVTAAVPLVFVLLLLVLIVILRHQVELDARQTDRSKLIIAKTSEVIEELNDVGVAFVIYDAQTKPFFEERFTTEVDKLRKSYHELVRVTRHNASHSAIVKRTLDDSEEALAILAKRKTAIEAGGRLDITEALELQDELNRIVKDLDSIIQDEHAAQLGLKETQRSSEWLVVALGLAMFAVVFGIVLVLGFRRSTARRLNVLMENSVRLGAEEPLAQRLEGTDEIAQIDKVFHEAALKLDETTRMRQEFVAMISHDMRTPLSAVKSTLELLAEGTWGELSEKAQDKVRRAQDNLRHTIDLINNLIDLEKVQSGRIEISPEVISLGPLLERCASLVNQLAESRHIEIELPDTDIPLYADEERLTQVVINLIGNAVKYSPDNSKITIVVAMEKAFVRVSINDQGPGIPEAERKKIFERYHQVPGSQKADSSGLGLANCKAIVEAHDGEIGVSEGPGGTGSSFWFRLPAD
jgi:signal transduction histidine kinase